MRRFLSKVIKGNNLYEQDDQVFMKSKYYDCIEFFNVVALAIAIF